MSKKFLMVLVMVTMIFSLAGCSKCISVEHENVEVTIVDEYHKPATTVMEYNVIYKMPMSKTVPATYKITVEYNGAEYVLTDSDTYNLYKNKVGQVVTGTLEIRSYDDGSIKYNIISLE